MENYDELIRQAVEGTETVLLNWNEQAKPESKEEEDWF